jgi:hypothetical protein
VDAHILPLNDVHYYVMKILHELSRISRDYPPLYLHDLVEVLHVLSGHVLHILPLEAVLHYTCMISWRFFMFFLDMFSTSSLWRLPSTLPA